MQSGGDQQNLMIQEKKIQSRLERDSFLRYTWIRVCTSFSRRSDGNCLLKHSLSLFFKVPVSGNPS